jgi:HPt (histidine-containing phosphotransfer) domain-containing protein
VAGGEGGKNPFHVREYYRDEFEDLLGSAFPRVRILGQHWLEGMALSPHPDLAGCGEIRAGCLPADKAPCGPAARSGRDPVCDTAGEPPYLIGLCAKREILDHVVGMLRPAALYGRAVRYEALKQAAHRLEGEFDRRGEWAQGLDRECRAKDDTIRHLQRELAGMRQELDERGRWAGRLNGELRQSGAMVQRLAEENRHLREALAARRPAGRSKVTR